MQDGQPAKSPRIRTGKRPRVLYTLSSFFPFDFFPDTVIVDEEKITIIYRQFPFQRRFYSLYYSSIMSVTIDSGLFFATMNFVLSKAFPEKQPDPIPHLGRTQAEYARKLIIGMVRLHELQDFDFSKKTIEEIIKSALNEGADYLGLT